MRTLLHLIVITSFSIVLSVCHQQKGNDDLPCIDLSINYPEKEVLLTDIADVSYLYLNSDDENFLYSGTFCTISQKTVIVLVSGRGSNQGDILIFSKDGSPKYRFNCRGNGPGECIFPYRLFFDEAADNIFVVDAGRSNSVIQVYSSTGEHKRELCLPQGVSSINGIVSFDDHSFLVRNENKMIKLNLSSNSLLRPEENIAPYYLISKEDGAVLDYFEMPIFPIFLGIDVNGRKVPALIKTYLLKGTEGVLLCNPENDTVFLYGRNKSLTPVIHKTPLAVTSNPITYINNCIDVNRYQFTEVYSLRTEGAAQAVFVDFPVKYYMRYKETGEVIHPKFLLSDYIGKEFIISPSTRAVNENGYYFNLDLLELKQAYRENRLSGKLKELAVTLKDDDNDVIVMVQFK